ncbi:MAG: peptide chain release factor 1 [Spirochaetales bacterium]|nr:peptide chain release factor 1 [Spirochaetales bacterium]
MIDKLEHRLIRFKELENLISDPSIMKDNNRYRQLTQEHAALSDIVSAYNAFLKLKNELKDAHELAEGETDPEMRAMAKEELKGLEEAISEQEQEMKLLLIPKDPLDTKNIIMEIRAGTGGDEAALFAADLYRMYAKYAENQGWRVEIMDANEIDLGGFKEIVFLISGRNVYENLRYESGVHRVQRVPTTESGGRVHTSAASVAVLPEAEEADIEIREIDLRIDTFRSQGAGGQHVNTTDSAVRITHIPTGVVVSCQDEKSQIKNRAKAMKVLRSRLLEAEEERKRKERADSRKSQVGSGDRSERIRTYNFPQNRLTDHRINLTLYKLDSVINGDLDELIEGLKLSAREELLKSQGL